MLATAGCSSSCRLLFTHNRSARPSLRQQQPSRWRRSSLRPTRTLCSRSEVSRESSVHVGVEPALPRSSLPLAGQPWYVRGPATLLLLGLLLQALRRIMSIGRKPSDLEQRGFLDESRNNRDPFLDDVMKNVNKMQYGDLTEEQISAARKRRSREMNPVDFDTLEVPPNHPFAMKRKVTDDEEELMRQRLEVKRGLPLQDLSGNRGFPAE